MCEAITEVTSGEAEHELINVCDTSAYCPTFCFTNELGLFLRMIKIIHGCELLIKPELHQCYEVHVCFQIQIWKHEDPSVVTVAKFSLKAKWSQVQLEEQKTSTSRKRRNISEATFSILSSQ